MIIFTLTAITVLLGSLVVEQVQCARMKRCGENDKTSQTLASASGSVDNGAAPPNCFPAIGFKMPNAAPTSLTNWWCNTDTEYAFVGFSYDVSNCPSSTQLKTDFSNMRTKFNARYVRLYGACDNGGFYDDIIEAAWNAGIGVHALIWFGFDGGNQWENRRDTLLKTLHSNPKAGYVTRLVQFGSEPLFDSVLPPSELGAQVAAAMKDLSSLQIQVDISELAYGWQNRQGSLQIMSDMGSMISAHILPFFDGRASIANLSWPLVLNDINWYQANALKKKLWLDQNGWPSATSNEIKSSSPSAVADIQNERDYFATFDDNCQFFKKQSIGWFAHSYMDQNVEGYGIHGLKGALKFPFQPQTSC